MGIPVGGTGIIGSGKGCQGLGQHFGGRANLLDGIVGQPKTIGIILR
jgi:hypothetical protein